MIFIFIQWLVYEYEYQSAFNIIYYSLVTEVDISLDMDSTNINNSNIHFKVKNGIKALLKPY